MEIVDILKLTALKGFNYRLLNIDWIYSELLIDFDTCLPVINKHFKLTGKFVDATEPSDKWKPYSDDAAMMLDELIEHNEVNPNMQYDLEGDYIQCPQYMEETYNSQPIEEIEKDFLKFLKEIDPYVYW